MNTEYQKIIQRFQESPMFPTCDKCMHFTPADSPRDSFDAPVCALGKFEVESDSTCKMHKYPQKDLLISSVFDERYSAIIRASMKPGEKRLSQCPDLITIEHYYCSYAHCNGLDPGLSADFKNEFTRVMTEFGFPEKVNNQ